MSSTLLPALCSPSAAWWPGLVPSLVQMGFGAKKNQKKPRQFSKRSGQRIMPKTGQKNNDDLLQNSFMLGLAMPAARLHNLSRCFFISFASFIVCIVAFSSSSSQSSFFSNMTLQRDVGDSVIYLSTNIDWVPRMGIHLWEKNRQNFLPKWSLYPIGKTRK